MSQQHFPSGIIGKMPPVYRGAFHTARNANIHNPPGPGPGNRSGSHSSSTTSGTQRNTNRVSSHVPMPRPDRFCQEGIIGRAPAVYRGAFNTPPSSQPLEHLHSSHSESSPNTSREPSRPHYRVEPAEFLNPIRYNQDEVIGHAPVVYHGAFDTPHSTGQSRHLEPSHTTHHEPSRTQHRAEPAVILHPSRYNQDEIIGQAPPVYTGAFNPAMLQSPTSPSSPPSEEEQVPSPVEESAAPRESPSEGNEPQLKQRILRSPPPCYEDALAYPAPKKALHIDQVIKINQCNQDVFGNACKQRAFFIYKENPCSVTKLS